MHYETRGFFMAEIEKTGDNMAPFSLPLFSIIIPRYSISILVFIQNTRMCVKYEEKK